MHAELTALLTVIVIDLVLAGDNAVVVGMAAAGLPEAMRRKAIVIGIAAAAGLRIVFAVFTTQLLGIIGLVLAGGLLLLWVTWKLWREIRAGGHREEAVGTDALDVELDGRLYGAAIPDAPGGDAAGSSKTFRQALIQIVVADVSMSLDNVLAVAGTARNHLWVLVVGLTLSVALMGVAATLIARVLKRHPWISYFGLVLIAWVAFVMIWDGVHEVIEAADQAGVI
ncbi:MAG: YjbE family putative metal transport protein [Bauldia sp.]|nr:MAG: YjbE family putative metal transport protein [Bauldia sp.]MBZ0229477.1 YjbE family putative metal transport protein [Bauldia sp.]